MPDPTRDLPTGSRVVLRRRLGTGERGPAGEGLTDVVGDLTRVDDTHLVVATRRGEVRVARREVAAAKVVPPRPVRRGAPHRAVGVADLERLMVEGNPPLERERLGGWLLRAGGGYTGRANSVLPLAGPDRPVAEALAAAERWYAARSLRPLLSLFGPTGFDEADDPLGARLLRRGYRPRVRTRVMTAAAGRVPPPRPPDGVSVSAGESLTEDWLAAADDRVRRNRAAAVAVLTGPRHQRFLAARDASGAVVGIARVSVGDGWGGVFGVQVPPEHRRRGIGRALTCAAAQWAHGEGAASVYLQVMGDNTEAVALYEDLGFTTHHEYVYLAAPTPT